jgi:pyruvate/2-oxoglutarate dehydrogenase complex dihydrolipoamide dehydrogenase (E3) component
VAAPYDLAVIGAGMGGVRAATEAAKLGFHVVLIERHKLGGT